jgi:hypothetical protein
MTTLRARFHVPNGTFADLTFVNLGIKRIIFKVWHSEAQYQRSFRFSRFLFWLQVSNQETMNTNPTKK